MKQYINKAAVVAEIDRLQEATMDKNQNFLSSYHEGIFDGLSMLEKFLDALDTKEVEEEPVSNDLEAEFVLYLKHKFNIPLEWDTLKTDGWRPSPYDILDIAKHFAQWQKEQVITKACEWLREHKDYVATEDNGISGWIPEYFIEEFKKAMEE